MQNIVLVVHLILALALIGIVLVQRSEGGGLGIGGGGGGGGMGGRPPASPMSKVTWALAIAFLATSLTLVILAARDAASDSVLERGGTELPATEDTQTDDSNSGGLLGNDLLPPSSSDAPATPPRADQ